MIDMKLGNILICLVLAASANVGTTLGKPLSDKNDANNIQPALMISNAEEIIKNSDIDKMNIEETVKLNTTIEPEPPILRSEHAPPIIVGLIIIFILSEIFIFGLCIFCGYFDL